MRAIPPTENSTGGPETAEADVERTFIRIVASNVDPCAAGFPGGRFEIHLEGDGGSGCQVGLGGRSEDEIHLVIARLANRDASQWRGSGVFDRERPGVASSADFHPAEAFLRASVHQAAARRLGDGNFRKDWCGQRGSSQGNVEGNIVRTGSGDMDRGNLLSWSLGCEGDLECRASFGGDDGARQGPNRKFVYVRSVPPDRCK